MLNLFWKNKKIWYYRAHTGNFFSKEPMAKPRLGFTPIYSTELDRM
jgi:hypothetical protein